MKSSVLQITLLLAVASTVFFTNLGASRLWDRDEPRNAGCAAEMQSRGDWVVPTFNDELRHQKPVLLYWLIMSAYTIFGQNEFAARFWSALLAIGSVGCTYGIARRLSGSNLAFWAGIILCTSFMFDVAARAATPDSALIFCMSSALLFYVLGTFRNRKENSAPIQPTTTWFPKHWAFIIGMYVSMGCGVLAKGPVGFLIPMAIIGMFMLIMRLPIPNKSPSTFLGRLVYFVRPFQPRHFFKTLYAMRPFTAACIVLAVSAPWYILVGLRTEGDFLQMFFVGEHFGRATMAMENHSGGIWYYPIAILVGFFPWSVFAVPILIASVHKHRSVGLSALEVLALCWIGVQVGLFSIAQTKLPSYVTPCYPALALLTASCLHDWILKTNFVSDRWIKAALGAFAFSGVLIAVGLGYVTSKFVPAHPWLVLIGLVPVAGALVAFWRLTQSNRQQTVAVVAVSSAFFSWLLFGFGTVAIDSTQNSGIVLERIAIEKPDQVVASYRGLESSWVFYSRHSIFECFDSAENSDHETLSRSKWWEKKPRVSPTTLVRNHADAVFLTTNEFVDELLDQLPAGYRVTATTDYFLRRKKIMLLERRPVSLANAHETLER